MIFKRNTRVDPILLERARDMRHEQVSAEKKLWHVLRNRQLNNYKFRRQQPVGPFIADFYCTEAMLVVELDGSSHDDRVEYDARRTTRLMRDGHHVIRFANGDVHWNLDAVLEEILSECERLSPRRPSP